MKQNDDIESSDSKDFHQLVDGSSFNFSKLTKQHELADMTLKTAEDTTIRSSARSSMRPSLSFNKA